MRRLFCAGIAFLIVASQTSCARSQPNEPNQGWRLGIAFQPRGFSESPTLSYPTEEEVVGDLQLLRSHGFRSLVTYGADDVLGNVPRLARGVGFDGFIVMGMWDPTSDDELQNTLGQAEFVDSYCVGNEGLGIRYTKDELARAMSMVRQGTGKPVTTSEPIDRYIEGPDAHWLIAESDWLFPIGHPALALRRGGRDAADWIMLRYDYLAVHTRKRIVWKEAGFPTDGAAWTDERTQLEFFAELTGTGIEYFYFEAFDQPGKQKRGDNPRVENYWGLFRADGSPKEAVQFLFPILAPTGGLR